MIDYLHTDVILNSASAVERFSRENASDARRDARDVTPGLPTRIGPHDLWWAADAVIRGINRLRKLLLR